MSTSQETLIERWLPIRALGIESQRERGASSALPPLYFLHVWWARRPLVVSRAAVLGSVLPTWSPDWPTSLRNAFPTEEAYRAWFHRALGIVGDSIAARRLIDAANAKGIRLQGNPFGYPRAFTISPSDEDHDLLLQLLDVRWGRRDLTVLDPMAGGGSIPFEAMRLGFHTLANELNPVASVILEATLRLPAQFGRELAEELRRYGMQVAESVERRLDQFFPRNRRESILAYVWARTVACPTTGKPVPLSPNWSLQAGSDPVAVRLIAEAGMDEVRFEIVRGREVAQVNPSVGTVRNGVGISPWSGDIIDGEHIKREAQAGRMGQQLYALAVKNELGKGFRSPTTIDVDAALESGRELDRCRSRFTERNAIPSEQIGAISNYDRGHRLYGMRAWADLFAPRQLLSLATMLEEVQAASREAISSLGRERGHAVATLLGIALDKCVDYNSRNSRWSDRGVRSTFDRHNFSLKWSHGEWDAAHNLWPWALDQVTDAYSDMAELVDSAQRRVWTGVGESRPVEVTQGNAAALDLTSASVDLVCIDPPYYGSVQYAELSDFFYVWLKRSVGDLYPEFFAADLTDKDDEAVANPARFASFGPRRKQLANQDYERKMGAAFREIHRVLRDDGVLTVMFTHKQVEAWDALSSALIGAGFWIETSWPVHTESEHSLHQARKNAASSTILLVCRKRREQAQPAWWDDLKGPVRRVARERAAEFLAEGITGVDLYISAFGPALSVISEHWPVLTSELDDETRQPKILRPETALDLAREEVIGLRKEGLLLGRPVTFDPVTDWYVMAWDAFRAEEFPADEARKLAIAVGIDAMEDVLVQRERLISKKQSSVVLQQPKARRRRDVVDPDAGVYVVLIDAVHTAMLVHDEDGLPACREFLRRTGYLTDGIFRACLQALLNAIPRTRDNRGFVRPEAATLDAMRNAFFDDLIVPPEEDVELPTATQTTLAWGGDEGAEEELEESDETEEG
jgi:adenine-specific DNA methylase